MSSNSLHSLELLEEINNYPDSTPNVENVLTYYLVSAKNNKSQMIVMMSQTLGEIHQDVQ